MSSKNVQGPSDGFSRREIKKAVTKKNFSHPMTLFPTSAGLAATIGAVLIGGPAVWAMSLGLVGLGVVSWCANQFLRFEKLASGHMAALREQMRIKREEKIGLLQHQLGENSKFRCPKQLTAVSLSSMKSNPTDLICVFPTGYGKSLCFTIAAALNPEKICVVVVPTRDLCNEIQKYSQKFVSCNSRCQTWIPPKKSLLEVLFDLFFQNITDEKIGSTRADVLCEVNAFPTTQKYENHALKCVLCSYIFFLVNDNKSDNYRTKCCAKVQIKPEGW